MITLMRQLEFSNLLKHQNSDFQCLAGVEDREHLLNGDRILVGEDEEALEADRGCGSQQQECLQNTQKWLKWYILYYVHIDTVKKDNKSTLLQQALLFPCVCLPGIF